MTPKKQDDALAALDWLENLLQGCVDTEGEHNEKCRILRQALTSGAGGDVDELYRGPANEDEAMCQVTSIYNDGWNAAIDYLASTGRIRSESCK